MKHIKSIAAVSCMIGSLVSVAYAQEGKDVTIVLPAAVDVVEPCHMNATKIVGLVVRQNIVETLIKLDPATGEPLPNLATGWEQTDPTTWRVNLREGVNFHDGTPFDANAAVKAIQRQFVPELACRDAIRLFSNIKVTATAVDDYTIDVKTDQPMPLMPVALSQVAMTAPSTPDTEAERHPVGTGPYTFTSWDPTQSLVVDRFDGYWGDQPEVEKATYVWRSEAALRASMVEVGEADIALQLAPQDATNEEMDTGFLNADTNRVRIFMDKPPLNDVRVRKAMNLAVDREALLGTILSPESVLASQYMLDNVNGYNPDLKPWPYDPAEAAKLIEEARQDGVPVDDEIVFYGSNHELANLSELMETLSAYWGEIGLHTKITLVDEIQHAAMRRKPYPTDRGPMLVHETHDNTSGDAYFTMNVYYTSEGALSNISDPDMDTLLSKASAAVGEERTELYQEANKIIHDDIIPDVLLTHMVSYIRVNPRISYTPNSTTATKLELSDITFN